MAKPTRGKPLNTVALIATGALTMAFGRTAETAKAELSCYRSGSGVYRFGVEPSPGFRAEKSLEACGPQPARRPDPPEPARRYDALIRAYSAEYDVDPALVKAMIHAESGFDRGAVSRRGARGLMQLMPATAESYGARNLHDPVENIRCGVRHLRMLLDRFGDDILLAVAAYNAGARTVARYRGLPPYPETRRYVEKVFRFRELYSADEDLALSSSAATIG